MRVDKLQNNAALDKSSKTQHSFIKVRLDFIFG